MKNYNKQKEREQKRTRNLENASIRTESEISPADVIKKLKGQDYLLNKQIYALNREYDKTTEQIKPSFRGQKTTENKEQYKLKNGRIDSKIHTGKDVIAQKEMAQLMGGYYYTQ